MKTKELKEELIKYEVFGKNGEEEKRNEALIRIANIINEHSIEYNLDLSDIFVKEAPEVVEEKDYDVDVFVKCLIEATCEYYHIEIDELMSRTRKQPLAEARQVIFCHIKQKFGLYRQYKKAIEKYTNLDRTTIIYSARKIEELIEFDKELRKRYESVYQLTIKKIEEAQ